ncbi:MAG: chorismate mutase, partial [Bacteroidota bacterium]
SDAKQQITPEVFLQLLANLRIPKASTDNEEFLSQLAELRRQIDEIDNDMIGMLGRRMRLAEQIGLYKKENNIAILQAQRWSAIIEKAQARGALQGLSKEFMEQFLRAVHQESINHQEEVISKQAVS